MKNNDFLFSQLDRRLMDRLSTIGDRENETDYKNKNYKCYEYSLSYGRALARISEYSTKQYFQGSSLLRKKKPETESEANETAAESFKEYDVKRRVEQSFHVLRNVKKLSKSKQLADKGMSRRTRLKITEKMTAIYAASKNKFSLQTLTMIAPATDRAAVKCLNKYLTVLRKNGDFNYIWVAEKQDGKRNGYEKATNNIHFHIVFDKKFNVIENNALWIVQQMNEGIINKAASEKLYNDYGVTFKDLQREGEIGCRQIQQYLNPVDVVNANSFEFLSAYLTKYITKNESKMSCAMWHCSRNISKLFTKQLISKKIFNETGNEKINSYYNKKNKKQYAVKSFVHQYGIINTIYNKKHFSKYMGEMESLNKWILDNIAIDKGVNISYERYQEILYSYDSKTGECGTKSINDFKYNKNQYIFKHKKYKHDTFIKTDFRQWGKIVNNSN